MKFFNLSSGNAILMTYHLMVLPFLWYYLFMVKTPPFKAALPIFQAGEAGIEPATYGFGDRCSAN